jgi:hypothetical protein
MGANQAMYDCTEMLPKLVKLNEIHRSRHLVLTEEVRESVMRYESKMLPRAFTWVEKSGGISAPVSVLQKNVDVNNSEARLTTTIQDVNMNGIFGFLLAMINSVVLPIVFAISKLF